MARTSENYDRIGLSPSETDSAKKMSRRIRLGAARRRLRAWRAAQPSPRRDEEITAARRDIEALGG